MYQTIQLTTGPMQALDITEKVRACVRESGVQNGICVLFVPHTTAAISLGKKDAEGKVGEDFQGELDRVIPLRANTIHVETPFDAAGHIKSSIVGVDITPPICDGELVLGDDQAVYVYEFDGPRPRKVLVKCYGK